MSEQSNQFKYIPKLNRSGYVQVSFPDFFKYYTTSKKITLPIEDYNLARKVIEFIFKRVWFYMITELWIFKAPYRMGMFYISENPYTKGFYKDWQRSREKGKIVYKYNFETDGRKPYIKWDRDTYKSINRFCYLFKAFRGSTHSLEGYRGLWGHVKEVANNPYKKDYRGHIL